MMKSTKLIVLVVCSSLAISACVRTTKPTTNVSTVSSGQELTDLKVAHDAGAISDKEYEKKRKEILKKKG